MLQGNLQTYQDYLLHINVKEKTVHTLYLFKDVK